MQLHSNQRQSRVWHFLGPTCQSTMHRRRFCWTGNSSKFQIFRIFKHYRAFFKHTDLMRGKISIKSHHSLLSTGAAFSQCALQQTVSGSRHQYSVTSQRGTDPSVKLVSIQARVNTQKQWLISTWSLFQNTPKVIQRSF